MTKALDTIVEALRAIVSPTVGLRITPKMMADYALKRLDELAVGRDKATFIVTGSPEDIGLTVLTRIANGKLSHPQAAAKETLRDMGFSPTLSNDELCEQLADIMRDIKRVRSELRRKGYPQETLNNLAVAHSWIETAQNDITGDVGTEIILDG